VNKTIPRSERSNWLKSFSSLSPCCPRRFLSRTLGGFGLPSPVKKSRYGSKSSALAHFSSVGSVPTGRTYCPMEEVAGCSRISLVGDCFGRVSVNKILHYSANTHPKREQTPMRRILVLALSLTIALWISGLSGAAASGASAVQGRTTHGKGKATKTQKTERKQARTAKKGKPEKEGLERAQTVASTQGVEHGISQAEAKQAARGKSQTATASKRGKGKHLAKGKIKKAGSR